jgi:hypothetical protein
MCNNHNNNNYNLANLKLILIEDPKNKNLAVMGAKMEDGPHSSPG